MTAASMPWGNTWRRGGLISIPDTTPDARRHTCPTCYRYVDDYATHKTMHEPVSDAPPVKHCIRPGCDEIVTRSRAHYCSKTCQQHRVYPKRQS